MGRDWIIKGGLKADDLVIIDNLIKLRPGTAVKVEDAPAVAAASGTATTTPAGKK